MPYQIQKTPDFIEISISGQTHKSEIIRILGELRELDPGKTLADMWRFEKVSQIPLVHFIEIAHESRNNLATDGFANNKTALVAADHLQFAQMELYRMEASFVPLNIQIFRSRETAIDWIKSAEPAVE